MDVCNFALHTPPLRTHALVLCLPMRRRVEMIVPPGFSLRIVKVASLDDLFLWRVIVENLLRLFLRLNH